MKTVMFDLCTQDLQVSNEGELLVPKALLSVYL